MALRNFRDIGGYQSKLGGKVRQGRVFRSSQPSNADAESLRGLLDLDFKLIADLRHPAEQAASPSPWPAHYADRMVRSQGEEGRMDAPHLAIMAMRPQDVETADSYFLQLYEDVPYDPAYRRMFGHVLVALASLDGRALIHCTLGKDRTGMLVGLLHSILGVSWDDTLADFIQSGSANDLGPPGEAIRAQVRQDHGFDMPAEVLSRLMSVQATYLTRYFESLGRRGGALETYLDELGVTSDIRARLQDVLLEA